MIVKRIIVSFLFVLSLFSSFTWANNSDVKGAFDSQRSDVQVEGVGEVVRVLPDDNKGSRHQKFILRLDNNLTILIAHNIDLAPRIPNLRKGDSVTFMESMNIQEKEVLFIGLILIQEIVILMDG